MRGELNIKVYSTIICQYRNNFVILRLNKVFELI